MLRASSMADGGEVNTSGTLPSAALEAMPRPLCPDDAASLTEIFGRFLRLYVAEGDASLATIRTYHAQATPDMAWCQRLGVSPSTTKEKDPIACRKYLVEAGYTPTTIALKLAVVRRLYESIQWRGVRGDNPVAGVRSREIELFAMSG